MRDLPEKIERVILQGLRLSKRGRQTSVNRLLTIAEANPHGADRVPISNLITEEEKI